MTTFSDFEASALQHWEDIRVALQLHGSILMVALAVGMIWLVVLAIRATGRKILGVVLAVIQMAVAVSLATGAGEGFSASYRKFCDWPVALLKWYDEKQNTGFFDPARQFPLTARLKADYSLELSAATATGLQGFAPECLIKKATDPLREKKEADAIQALANRSAFTASTDLNCKTWAGTLEQESITQRGSRTYFAVRHSEGVELAAGLSMAPRVEPAALNPKVEEFLRRAAPFEDKTDVRWAGRAVGDASGIVSAGYVGMPILLQFPAGLMNLGFYGAALMAARGASWLAYRSHRLEQECIAKLDSLDTDAGLHPLHAFTSHFIAGNETDRAYEAAFKGCLADQEAYRWYMWIYFIVAAVLIGAGFVYANVKVFMAMLA